MLLLAMNIAGVLVMLSGISIENPSGFRLVLGGVLHFGSYALMFLLQGWYERHGGPSWWYVWLVLDKLDKSNYNVIVDGFCGEILRYKDREILNARNAR